MRVLSNVCDPVIVVLGYHAERIRPVVDPRARVVINPRAGTRSIEFLANRFGAASGERGEDSCSFPWIVPPLRPRL